jgi:hypothetical protein
MVVMAPPQIILQDRRQVIHRAAVVGVEEKMLEPLHREQMVK